MTSSLLVAGLMVAFAVGVACAQDDGDVVAAARDESKAGAQPNRGPFTRQSNSCGNAGNSFFCGQVTKATAGNLYLAPYSAKFKVKGTATVTWSGNVYCQVSASDVTTLFQRHTRSVSYFAHLGLVTSATEDFAVNATGAASVGEELTVAFDYPANGQDVLFFRTILTPVTLTKVYNVKKPATVEFRVAVKPDFRLFKEISFCNVNGGATTVQFQPR